MAKHRVSGFRVYLGCRAAFRGLGGPKGHRVQGGGLRVSRV